MPVNSRTLLGRLDSYDEGLKLNKFIWELQPDLARSVSLHYPMSIAKVVSLAETTELAVKASCRPNWILSTAGNQTKGPNQQNGGQGQWRGRGGLRGRFRGGSSVGSSGTSKGNAGGRKGRGWTLVILRTMILLLVIGVGCVAIWPVTVPKLEQRHMGVEMLSLPNVNSLNRGKKAQEVEVEAEVGLLDSGASTSYTTRPGMSIRWTMQVNCMSPSDMNLM